MDFWLNEQTFVETIVFHLMILLNYSKQIKKPYLQIANTEELLRMHKAVNFDVWRGAGVRQWWMGMGWVWRRWRGGHWVRADITPSEYPK